MKTWIALALAMLCVTACGQEAARPVFHASGNPQHLSDWNVLISDQQALELVGNTAAYDLATPLFSDYALKLRTITLPDGTAATYRPDRVFDFPIGTIITKTFYYAKPAEAKNAKAVMKASPAALTDNKMFLSGLRLIETRILARRENGWIALPYVWDDEQMDASLKRTGSIIPLSLIDGTGDIQEFTYLTPNQNQCAGCHATNNTTRAIEPIGPKARHLNKKSSFVDAFNQLDHWIATGMLVGDFSGVKDFPKNADWSDQSASLDARARAYLDANCSHCHNPTGPADTSGLNLEPDAAGPALGLCKNPIAAGAGSGGHRVDIDPGNPDGSIFIYRMESTDPGAMMPEVGRALIHQEGVALIREWIDKMDGTCV